MIDHRIKPCINTRVRNQLIRTTVYQHTNSSPSIQEFGTDVTLIEMMDSLVPREDGDIAEAFTGIARDRHEVHTGYRASEVTESNGNIIVTAESEDGDEIEVMGDELLVALGRQPGTDRIDLDATTVETNDDGFIETDDQLRTNVENVWAIGDSANNGMFKHSGDYF
jgi:mycothione reductase